MCGGPGLGGLMGDAIDFTKNVTSTLASHFGDSLIPGFDPVLGNPLKGDFMSGDAVITPTGNFTPDVWQDMYDRAGDDHGYLDRFYGYNQIADKVAPVIAGGYAGNGISNLADAAGSSAGAGAGAGSISGSGTSLAGSGNAIGSLDGLSTTGSGWGAVGSGAGGLSGGSLSASDLGSSDALGSTSGMSPINPAAPTAIQGNNVGLLDSIQNLFQQGQDIYNSPLGKTLQGGGKLFGAYQDYMGQRQAQSAASDNLDYLNNLFSPNSPYAQQMQKTLARRDAAAGRNSQYGPRATALAADLAKNAAAVRSSPTYLQSLGIANNRAAPYSDLGAAFSGAGQLFNGLKGLF